MDDDEDVYDVVDEDKYAQIVEDRRNAGDFVVDDGKQFINTIFVSKVNNFLPIVFAFVNRRSWLL